MSSKNVSRTYLDMFPKRRRWLSDTPSPRVLRDGKQQMSTPPVSFETIGWGLSSRTSRRLW